MKLKDAVGQLIVEYYGSKNASVGRVKRYILVNSIRRVEKDGYVTVEIIGLQVYSSSRIISDITAFTLDYSAFQNKCEIYDSPWARRDFIKAAFGAK